MKRFLNAFKLGVYAFKNPLAINASMLKMLTDLLALILTVSKENKHRMTHIAFIHPEDNTEHQIVSIWAGAGVGADPTKRISELIEENIKLKRLLSESIYNKQQNETSK